MAGGGRIPAPSRRALVAWSFYDWANSAFPTLIITFVFAAYFTKAVAPDVVSGTAMWGWAMSASALGVALAGPVLGAVADRGGHNKRWLGFFTAVCVVATAALVMVAPNATWVVYALVMVAIANFAFERGVVFYPAMLPALVAGDRIGRISGWAWGLGYAGGLSCLALALVAFVQAEVPWFGVPKADAMNVRATAVLTALWVGVFSIPLFLWAPDKPGSGKPAGTLVREGVSELWKTLKAFRQHKVAFQFLFARMIYTDGINTLFAFGGIYAAGTFGMSFSELIIFGIGINVTAGIGAAGFGWLDDRLGPKTVVMIALAGLSILGAALLMAQGKMLFWAFALPLGLFVGPAQAASRSYMARLAPRGMETEMFGLYALSGKATAFLGPALLGWATLMFDSQRAGMATILAFFALGAGLLVFVPALKAPGAHGG